MKGWIKLHREIRFSSIFQNESLLKTWIWCLCKASHKKHKQVIGNQFIELEPGEFITGRKAAGEELNVPPTTAWNRLKLLEKNESIEIKSESKYSIVKICNWESYQEQGENLDIKRTGSTQDNNNVTEDEELQSRQQMDSSLTANGQQMDTNKNVKNDIYINSYNNSDQEKEIFEDENFKQIVRLHQNNLGTISAFFVEDLKAISEAFHYSMYEAAIKRAAENNSLKFGYVKAILKNWYRDKIFNLEDLEKHENQYQANKDKKNSSKPQSSSYKPRPQQKNKFHNFKGRTEDYTEDDMEAIARRKREEYYKKIDEKKKNNIINFNEKLG